MDQDLQQGGSLGKERLLETPK